MTTLLKRKHIIAATRGSEGISPFTRVQSTGRTRTASAASVAVSFAAQPIVGNGIIVLSQTWGGAFPGTCTDNRGNTYALAIQTNSGISAAMVQIWYCSKVVTTGSPFTITVNVGSGVFYTASAVEYSGVGAGLVVDKTASTWRSAPGPVTCGPLAALTGSSVILAGMFAVANNNSFITVQSVSPPWIQEHEDLDNPIFIGGEADTRGLGSAIGTTPSISWTMQNDTTWQSALAAFKPS